MAAEYRPPDFYKFPRELYEQAKSLPRTQGAKLCMAALGLFLDGEEPSGLSVRANDVMSGWHGRIVKARACFEDKAGTKRNSNGEQMETKCPPNEIQMDDTKGPLNSENVQMTCGRCADSYELGVRSLENRSKNGDGMTVLEDKNGSANGALATDSEGKEEEAEWWDVDSKAFIAMDPESKVEAVCAYCESEGLAFLCNRAEEFVNEGEANGWVFQGARLNDWKAFCRKRDELLEASTIFV